MNTSTKTLVTLLALALMAIIPLSSSAQSGGCTLNGVPVPGDPTVIEGTKSADVIDCSSSPTRHDIYADNGNDTIYGSEFDDFIAGGGRGDLIYGNGGDDAIDGGSKDDTIYGGDGNDIIFGGVGSSPASGVGCELQTAAAEPLINHLAMFGQLASAGANYLWKGGSGDDTIYGGDGNDCINAGSGEDFVYGEAGNDTLIGGNHTDLLDGGANNDWCSGGETYVGCETIE
ncbi:MAG: calcium-binding protein [Anaerolineae bacterium]